MRVDDASHLSVMPSDIDELDEDAYLYGSNEKEEVDSNKNLNLDKKSTEENHPSDSELPAKRPREASDNEEDESSSDDDSIIFILGPNGSSEYSTRTAGAAAAKAPAPVLAPVSDTPTAQTASIEPAFHPEEKSSIPPLDMDKVPDYNGKPITQTNIEELEEKPWRRMGADITDYFNYGFDELTWIAYCNRQDNLRATYNPQRTMQMFAPMMMPPMMGMPGMFPQMPQQRR